MVVLFLQFVIVLNNSKMRRIVFYLESTLVIICFYSCTMTKPVTSYGTYKGAIKQVEQELSDEGFHLSGSRSETKNEVSVSGVSYSRYTGYGSAMSNNYWQYQEYQFDDSAGNSISYSVKYQLKKDNNGTEYVENLEVTNCSATKKYNEICGNSGVVKENIEKVIENPDQTATVTNKSATITVAAIGTIGGVALLSALIALLLL